ILICFVWQVTVIIHLLVCYLRVNECYKIKSMTFSVVFVLWRRKKAARRGILIMGLSDSGKTLLFSQLLHNKYVQTHTSVKENIDEYIAGNGSLKVIDIPGHERLRGKFFDEYKAIARGIVYVVDSVTFQKDIRDVAE
ncbi:hypothetical protein ANN_19760, partial [Periplaneta americana]